MENIFRSNELLISSFEGTNTKIAWAIECLMQKCADFNDFRNDRKIIKISNVNISNMKGFISRIYLITVEFEGGDIPFKFVMKMPGANIVIDDSADEIAIERDLHMLAHNREVSFLSNFQDIPKLNILKCYGAREWIHNKQEGAILMNYLGESHTHVGYFDNLSLKQAESVFEQIFIMQEYFLMIEDDSWKKNFTGFLKGTDYATWTKAFDPNFTLMKSFVDESLYKDTEAEIIALASNYVTIFEYNASDLPLEKGNQFIFSHCDSWINNFLWAKDDQGRASDEVTLLDFQACSNSTIGNDLSNTLVNSTDQNIRRKMEATLPAYYEKLKTKCGSKLTMSYEMFKRTYDISLIEKALLFAMCVEVNLKIAGAPTDSGDATWDAKKKQAGIKTITALNDAVFAARVHKPLWLIKKD